MKFYNYDKNYEKAFKYLKTFSRTFCIKKYPDPCPSSSCKACKLNNKVEDINYINDIKKIIDTLININRTYGKECGTCLIKDCREKKCATTFIKMFKLPIE